MHIRRFKQMLDGILFYLAFDYLAKLGRHRCHNVVSLGHELTGKEGRKLVALRQSSIR